MHMENVVKQDSRVYFITQSAIIFLQEEKQENNTIISPLKQQKCNIWTCTKGYYCFPAG